MRRNYPRAMAKRRARTTKKASKAKKSKASRKVTKRRGAERRATKKRAVKRRPAKRRATTARRGAGGITTVGGIVRTWAQQRPSRVALVQGERTQTWSEQIGRAHV